jgi:hypothetical protein
MTGLLLQFISENIEMLIKNKLKENFLLHLICLYDYQQINKNTLELLIKEFDEKRRKYEHN